jgi:hypothetical protein
MYYSCETQITVSPALQNWTRDAGLTTPRHWGQYNRLTTFLSFLDPGDTRSISAKVLDQPFSFFCTSTFQTPLL